MRFSVDEAINRDGSIEIRFPQYDAHFDVNDPGQINFISVFLHEGKHLKCNLIFNQESNIDKDATCEKFTQKEDGSNFIRIKNAFVKGRDYGKDIVFVLDKVRNPQSMRPLDNLELWVTSNEGNIIYENTDCRYAAVEQGEMPAEFI